jgi:hypothetical protein
MGVGWTECSVMVAHQVPRCFVPGKGISHLARDPLGGRIVRHPDTHQPPAISFTSGPEEQFAPDLALLVSLVVDRSLTPQTGPKRNWRDIARVADELRDRRVGGKAVFREP